MFTNREYFILLCCATVLALGYLFWSSIQGQVTTLHRIVRDHVDITSMREFVQSEVVRLTIRT